MKKKTTKKEEKIRFLIIGDLHGNKPKQYYKDVDAIIAPGDFCSDKPRKYMFSALKKRLENPDYDGGWGDIAGKKRAEKMLQKSLRDGRNILEQLNKIGIPVFALPGNWDWTGGKGSVEKTNRWKKQLIKGLTNIKDCHKRFRTYKGILIGGHGITSGPEYPVKETIKKLTKKQIQEKKKDYKKMYNEMNKKMVDAKKKKKPMIFLTHNVPYNTKIDRVNFPASPMHKKHMGSYLARELTLKHKPLVCIGGHMHEHHGKTKLGTTTCINAGFGGTVNTLLEIENGNITKIEFKHEGKKTASRYNIKFWK